VIDLLELDLPQLLWWCVSGHQDLGRGCYWRWSCSSPWQQGDMNIHEQDSIQPHSDYTPTYMICYNIN